MGAPFRRKIFFELVLRRPAYRQSQSQKRTEEANKVWKQGNPPCLPYTHTVYTKPPDLCLKEAVAGGCEGRGVVRKLVGCNRLHPCTYFLRVGRAQCCPCLIALFFILHRSREGCYHMALHWFELNDRPWRLVFELGTTLIIIFPLNNFSLCFNF